MGDEYTVQRKARFRHLAVVSYQKSNINNPLKVCGCEFSTKSDPLFSTEVWYLGPHQVAPPPKQTRDKLVEADNQGRPHAAGTPQHSDPASKKKPKKKKK